MCVVSVAVVACMCVCRLNVHTTYSDTFDLIRPMIDRLVCQEWRVASKGQCAVKWCSSRQKMLSLLMPAASLKKICEAEDWKKDCSKDFVACMEPGTEIAELLFASCIGDTLVRRTETIIHNGVGEMIEYKPAHGMDLSAEVVGNIKAKTMKELMAMTGTMGTSKYTKLALVCSSLGGVVSSSFLVWCF